MILILAIWTQYLANAARPLAYAAQRLTNSPRPR